MSRTGTDSVAAYCEVVIRFIAGQMLDPHRYFEQKLLGQLALCRTDLARARLLHQLVEWIAQDGLLTAMQREQLDAGLAARQWPSTVLAEREPDLALWLLRGESFAVAGKALQRALGNAELNSSDRNLLAVCRDGRGG